jgi:hypothetical protein
VGLGLGSFGFGFGLGFGIICIEVELRGRRDERKLRPWFAQVFCRLRFAIWERDYAEVSELGLWRFASETWKMKVKMRRRQDLEIMRMI